MKNRVYKIKDKILVQGNENELTENEVLIKEQNGSIILKERVNGEVKNITEGSTKIKTKDIQVQPGSESEIDLQACKYSLNPDEHDLESYFMQFLESDEVYFEYDGLKAILGKAFHKIVNPNNKFEILVFMGPTYSMYNGEISIYRPYPVWVYLSRMVLDGSDKYEYYFYIVKGINEL